MPRAMASLGIVVCALFLSLTGCKQRSVSPSVAKETTASALAPREFRGAWISTVYNLDWPSKAGLTVEQQKQEMRVLLDKLKGYGINVALLQVRPEGDAVYASKLEPWSRSLTGKQGGNPGYDPLIFFIEESHKRGMEAHAWLNPYRAATSPKSETVAPHVAKTIPKYVYTLKNVVWMDPSAKEIENHTYNVVMDIVNRYDIDGLHIDDYFYPYPSSGDLPDEPNYQAYVKAGGKMSKGDWRRDNVNRLVERLYKGVKAKKPWVDFGISPFGVYRNDIPKGVRSLDQYEEIFADPKLWIEKKWVDYLAPQLYWPIDSKTTPFETLLTWWASLSSERPTYPGLAPYKLVEKENAYPLSEMVNQMKIIQKHAGANVKGALFFKAINIANNDKGFGDELKKIWPNPAITPANAYHGESSPAAPAVSGAAGKITFSHANPSELLWFAVYGTNGVLKQAVHASSKDVALAAGKYRVSAVSRIGLESPAIDVEVK